MLCNLFLFVRVEGVEVLLDEVLPELDLGAGEVVHLPPAQVPVLDPERVDQVVPLLLGPRNIRYLITSQKPDTGKQIRVPVASTAIFFRSKKKTV